MHKIASALPYAIAIVAGAALWIATASVGGRVEPWDAPIYWQVAYPTSIVLSGVLGFTFPTNAWRWAVIVIFTQVVVMIMRGAGLGLLPLGLILLAILSLPAVALAALAAILRLRMRKAGI
jgi:hypothetical protein